MRPALTVTRTPDNLADFTVSDGFNHPEMDPAGNRFVWMQGSAYTTFDFTSHTSFAISVALRSAALAGGPDTPVHILVNDRDLALIHPEPARNDFQTVRLTIPRFDALQLKAGIESTPFKAAGDRGTLGTMVQSISIDTRGAWATIGDRHWLYRSLPIFGAVSALLLVVASLGERRRSRVAASLGPILRYCALFLWFLGTLFMALAVVLLIRIGPIDRDTYYFWSFGSIYVGAFFGAGALALPYRQNGARLFRLLADSPVIDARRELLRRLRDLALVGITLWFALTFVHVGGPVVCKISWTGCRRSMRMAWSRRIARITISIRRIRRRCVPHV